MLQSQQVLVDLLGIGIVVDASLSGHIWQMCAWSGSPCGQSPQPGLATLQNKSRLPEKEQDTLPL